MSTKTSTPNFNDRDIQQLIGRMLRYGVFSSCVLVLLGGIVYLLMYGNNAIQGYHIFKADSHDLFQNFSPLNAKSVIFAGVVLLIATPIIRIICSLVAFSIEKDKLYIVITSIVLLIILFNISYGLLG